MKITIEAATADELSWVEQAVRLCPQAMAEFGGFYGQATTKLHPLLGPARTLWLITTEDDRVGFIDADRHEQPLGVSVTYFVIPRARRQGACTAALRLLAQHYHGTPLVAAIAPGNVASTQTALASGMRRQRINEWNEVVYETVNDPQP